MVARRKGFCCLCFAGAMGCYKCAIEDWLRFVREGNSCSANAERCFAAERKMDGSVSFAFGGNIRNVSRIGIGILHGSLVC